MFKINYLRIAPFFFLVLFLSKNTAFSVDPLPVLPEVPSSLPKKHKLSSSADELPALPVTKKGKDELSKNSSLEEEYKFYTHSHHTEIDCRREKIDCHTDPSSIKALYVEPTARIIYEDKEGSVLWERSVENEQDDEYYSKLLLLISQEDQKSRYQKGSPNHLLCCFEVGYWNEDAQGVEWTRTPLFDEEERYEDYCSKPPMIDQFLDVCDSNDEKKRTEFVVKKGTLLVTKDKKVVLEDNIKHYPVIEHIDIEWIAAKEDPYGVFPHSEIPFLNRLWTDRALLKSVFTKAPSRNFKALIIKLYSYNDNCSRCQEAICQFQPQFQEKINTEFGINIPVYFVGINNAPWNSSAYWIYDGKNCGQIPLISKEGLDIKAYLREGQEWKNLPLSQYVPSGSSFFSSRDKFKFRAYDGEIRLTPENKSPFLIQRLRLTTLNDIKDQMKEDFACD